MSLRTLLTDNVKSYLDIIVNKIEVSEKKVFNTTATGPYGTPEDVILNVQKIDTNVTIMLSELQKLSTNTAIITITQVLEEKFRPKNNLNQSIVVIDNSTFQLGRLNINSSTGVITIGADLTNANFASILNAGFLGHSISYIA